MTLCIFILLAVTIVLALCHLAYRTKRAGHFDNDVRRTDPQAGIPGNPDSAAAQRPNARDRPP
jgi:hypothetical protein